METKIIIEKTIRDIKSKGESLKLDANTAFKKIIVAGAANKGHQQSARNKGNAHIVLYGLAIISGATLLFVDYLKPLSFIVLAGSLFGGYKYSSKPSSGENGSAPKMDAFSLKTKVTSQIITSTKQIKSNWATYMGHCQSMVHEAINTSELSQEVKMNLLSKTFTYEDISISLTEITSKINSINDGANLVNDITKYKDDFLIELKKCIDIAVSKQTKKYSDVLNSI